MDPEDQVCLCFRVSQRKVVNYCKRERPPVASLISECLAAGTGCGWCRPFLKRIHKQVMDGDENPYLPFSVEDYANKRGEYRKTGERPDEQAGDTDKS